MQCLSARVATKEVHELVARYSSCPSGQRPVALVGGQRIVHGQQCFLKNVFDVIETMRKVSAKKGAKMLGQPIEELAIQECIASQAEEQLAL